MSKKIGNKILLMVVTLGLMFLVSSLINVLNLKEIEKTSDQVGNKYVEILNEYGTIGKCVERSQKYMNIICLYDNADLRAGLIKDFEADRAIV